MTEDAPKRILDGEAYRLALNDIDPKNLSARELLDYIVKLEVFLARVEVCFDISNKQRNPDSEVYVQTSRVNLKRFYDEFDRKYTGL